MRCSVSRTPRLLLLGCGIVTGDVRDLYFAEAHCYAKESG